MLKAKWMNKNKEKRIEENYFFFLLVLSEISETKLSIAKSVVNEYLLGGILRGSLVSEPDTNS